MDSSILKVGETVVALNTPTSENSQYRIEGFSYIVKHIRYCLNCGEVSINIGRHSLALDTVECKCGEVTNNHLLQWTSSRHFCRPKDLRESLERCILEQNFEMAEVLRRTIKDMNMTMS